MTDTKDTTGKIRQEVWRELRKVARPDSRMHFEFTEFIPDFEGSDAATAHVERLPGYQEARYGFVAPDNCLAGLRSRMLEQGKSMVVSTYGIRRGFVLLEPAMVPHGQERFAGWLDGLEYFGRPIDLAEMAERGPFDFLATGASAVSRNGVRFGKGHGYFDLEWAIFTELDVTEEATPIVTVIHDVQLVDQALSPSATDVIVDHIATPGELHAVERTHPRPRGIHWDLLTPERIAAMPPLEALRKRRPARRSAR